MLIELAEFCHFVTRIKIVADGARRPRDQRDRAPRAARELAQGLALGPLTRAWQMLFKGVEDIKDRPRPLASAEMALIRLAYAAELPGPEDALRRLAESAEARARRAPRPPPAPAARLAGRAAAARSPRRAPLSAPRRAAPRQRRRGWRSFEDVVALARAKRDVQMVHALEREVRLARFEPGRIEFSLIEGASPALAQTLTRKLGEWTGERWMVALVAGRDAPTIHEQRRGARGGTARAASPRIRWCAR